MDTIHDMGGMHGFGRVEEEANEPVFHADWERRVFAMVSAVPFAALFGDDQFRPAIERIPPERYLSISYYEKWLDALTSLLVDRGWVTEAELADPASVPVAPRHPKAALPSDVVPAIWAGASQSRPGVAVLRRFQLGDAVVTKRQGSPGHTRLPRYARGKAGCIIKAHGAFLVADRNSIGDQTPEMLYTVAFDARELWGPEARSRDSLTLDLWDRYLDPA
ncbi:MAG: nitrile hydratase subunit beta [Hyphomicrobiaceae bacterium]